MAEKTLESLSNNKLLVAIVAIVIGWVMSTSNRVSAVETKQAVQAEQISNIEKTTSRIEETTKQIWSQMQARKP